MADRGEQRNWNGARWWKFDFHTHTPKSDDYGRGENQEALRQISPREWLLNFMRAGIDCVAVTDHNSGAWIDTLRDALVDLENEKPTGFRPLYLFPGVEVSVHGGLHLLAIFAADVSAQGISNLLDAVGYGGTQGSSDGVTSKSFPEVAREIDKRGGLAIPAHVDQKNGLFAVLEGDFDGEENREVAFRISGTTLEQALQSRNIFAYEVVDTSKPNPPAYALREQSGKGWTQVVGSDSHHPASADIRRYPGSHYTWVKMGAPSFEGLKLALLDGPLSVRRFDETPDPNQHARNLLESIEVENARYMGRPDPFRLRFNPWLNALIGGRGTGKSTTIEFLRLALRRQDEVLNELESDFEKYNEAYLSRKDDGLLTESTAIRVVYRKDDSRFLLQWSPSGELDSIQRDVDGAWRSVDAIASQFPVRIFSQKQVFYMANETSALLDVVDDAIQDEKLGWESRWREERSRYMTLRSKIRELEGKLQEEARLKGELSDVKRKLEIFEKASHAEVLKSFQRRRRQERVVDEWTAQWSDAGDRIRHLAEDLVPSSLGEMLTGTGPEEEEILRRADDARKRILEIQRGLEDAAAEVDQVGETWKGSLTDSSWHEALGEAVSAYESLKSQLEKEGAGDPSEYGPLVQQRHNVEQQLSNLEEHRQQVGALRTQAIESLEKLQVLRRELTELRHTFLQGVLKENRYVQIGVKRYGAADEAEGELRELVQKQDGTYEKVIGAPGGDGLLGLVYPESSVAQGSEDGIKAVKERVRRWARGDYDPDEVADNRFATHLAKLTPEALDRLDIWFPQDALDVRYSLEGDGRHFRPIREGSPGQKTAALLAFLLSYGDEPLVLDQPEDDLDNHLIYDLIVTQLREIKRRRQVIVVTHNANIVVNGDAELVVALQAVQGQTQIECEGGLQQQDVRDTICEVMEGGKRAFEQRYRRIALEGRHV